MVAPTVSAAGTVFFLLLWSACVFHQRLLFLSILIYPFLFIFHLHTLICFVLFCYECRQKEVSTHTHIHISTPKKKKRKKTTQIYNLQIIKMQTKPLLLNIIEYFMNTTQRKKNFDLNDYVREEKRIVYSNKHKKLNYSHTIRHTATHTHTSTLK